MTMVIGTFLNLYLFFFFGDIINVFNPNPILIIYYITLLDILFK